MKASYFLPILLFAIAAPAAAIPAPPSPWLLRGRVLHSTESSEPGHFEVGLFLSLGADGLPVGYPVVQAILPAGRSAFSIRVPSRLPRAYLFAEHVSSRDGRRRWIAPASNPWDRASNRFAELYLPANERARSLPAADQWVLRGNVGTVFARPGSPLPQAGVEVRVRGRGESARTDSSGNFSLALPVLRGTLALELLKPGFHPAIVSVKAGQAEPLRAELASRQAVELLSQRLGTLQASHLGVFLGRSSLAGLSVRLTHGADGPFYFDDNGVPSRSLAATSSDGRFLFLNVRPGAGFLESELGGEPVAPVAVSMVEGGELVQRHLVPMQGSVRGRLFDVISGQGLLPLAGARVRVEGGHDFSTTDAWGAFHLGGLKWMRGEKLSLLFSADRFHNHRFQAEVDSGRPLSLYAFPAAYLERLANLAGVALDPGAGILVGKSAGPAVRVDALAEQASENFTKDFYFDARGRMRSTPAKTDPRFGTFLLFNVPAGRVLLLGNDDSGTLRYSHSAFASPSTVNVEVGDP